MDVHRSRHVHPTSSLILSVLFLTDLHPGRNGYLTSWFILSVLFLTGGEMSEVPTCVWDPPHMTFTPVGTSTSTAGSCCLCCF